MASPDVVLVVSNEADTRKTLSRLFRRAGYRTDEVDSGEGALTASDDGEIALAIVDLGLDDMSSYELCYELRQRPGREVRIILLAPDETAPSERVAGFLIGADDYVTAPFHPDELLARARRLLARPDRTKTPRGLELTPRETEVLRLMADALGQDAIAEKLFISRKTVATHVQHILTKLGVHSRAEAVALAYRSGLIEEGA